MNDQLDSGVIEKGVELERGEKVYYLPQSCYSVRGQNNQGRIVYDASSKGKKSGMSLNDCLHVGPSLNPLSCNILLPFHENKIVLVGDIEKAFLNVNVDQRERDCLRFLWLEDPPDMSRVIYRFCSVVFGLNAFPFLLNATLRPHYQVRRSWSREFVKKLIESFYVDEV